MPKVILTNRVIYNYCTLLAKIYKKKKMVYHGKIVLMLAYGFRTQTINEKFQFIRHSASSQCSKIKKCNY